MKSKDNLDDLDQSQNLMGSKLEQDPCYDFFCQKDPIISIYVIMKKHGT